MRSVAQHQTDACIATWVLRREHLQLLPHACATSGSHSRTRYRSRAGLVVMTRRVVPDPTSHLIAIRYRQRRRRSRMVPCARGRVASMPSAVAPVVLVCRCLQHTRARHVRSVNLYREWAASPELLATSANRHGESVAHLSRAPRHRQQRQQVTRRVLPETHRPARHSREGRYHGRFLPAPVCAAYLNQTWVTRPSLMPSRTPSTHT